MELWFMILAGWPGTVKDVFQGAVNVGPTRGEGRMLHCVQNDTSTVGG
jgi:hypothetical protein